MEQQRALNPPKPVYLQSLLPGGLFFTREQKTIVQFSKGNDVACERRQVQPCCSNPKYRCQSFSMQYSTCCKNHAIEEALRHGVWRDLVVADFGRGRGFDLRRGNFSEE
jgi:hypothetical protein